MISQEGRDRIDDWYEDEWWHRGNEDYWKLAEMLVDLGIEEETAINILESAHAITSNEYGG